jgi:GNAT superfamily N-acetyltransferase
MSVLSPPRSVTRVGRTLADACLAASMLMLDVSVERHPLAGLIGRRKSRGGDDRQRAVELVRLRDGSLVWVRAVQPRDTALLLEGFARLSALSRWRRFLRAKPELTPAEVRYFTDVDHYDHEALGAIDAATGRGVAIARYIRSAGDPGCAEVAVTVIDEWQRRGLATVLLSRLADRARQAEISSFTALVSAENDPMITLLSRDNAGVQVIHMDRETVEYEIALAPFTRSLAGRLAPRASA